MNDPVVLDFISCLYFPNSSIPCLGLLIPEITNSSAPAYLTCYLEKMLHTCVLIGVKEHFSQVLDQPLSNYFD